MAKPLELKASLKIGKNSLKIDISVKRRVLGILIAVLILLIESFADLLELLGVL